MSHTKGWIGVDLDGTLAHYDRWRGVEHIGEPIKVMVDRVKRWLAAGKDVRIFTARVWLLQSLIPDEQEEGKRCLAVIDAWCDKHIGQRLPVTNIKDFAMVELWDDRTITVERNTGRILGRNPTAQY